MKIIPIAFLGLDWSVVFAQVLNFLFVIAIIALPFVIWSWLKKMKEGKSETEGISAVPGLVVFGLILTGFAGIVHSFEFGTPVSLIASSLSFGLIFYVTFN